MSNAAERPTDPLSEAAEAGYWACFFDQGRGTFTPWSKKGGMKLRIEAQDRRLLKQLQAAFGGSLSRSRGPYERQWSGRVMYALTISGTPARQMVTRVLTHMKNPRRREVAEAWLSSYPNGRADGAPDFRPAAKLHLVHGTS